MATGSGFVTLEDLKRQAEEIGLEGKEKKFLTQGWKMIQENEVRKLKLAAEAKERKLAAEERKLAVEAEERKLAAEAEERKLAAEAEERKLAAETAKWEAERKHKLEMEKLRLESERLNGQRRASSEDQQAALSQASQNTAESPSASWFCGQKG